MSRRPGEGYRPPYISRDRDRDWERERDYDRDRPRYADHDRSRAWERDRPSREPYYDGRARDRDRDRDSRRRYDDHPDLDRPLGEGSSRSYSRDERGGFDSDDRRRPPAGPRSSTDDREYDRHRGVQYDSRALPPPRRRTPSPPRSARPRSPNRRSRSPSSASSARRPDQTSRRVSPIAIIRPPAGASASATTTRIAGTAGDYAASAQRTQTSSVNTVTGSGQSRERRGSTERERTSYDRSPRHIQIRRQPSLEKEALQPAPSARLREDVPSTVQSYADTRRPIPQPAAVSHQSQAAEESVPQSGRQGRDSASATSASTAQAGRGGPAKDADATLFPVIPTGPRAEARQAGPRAWARSGGSETTTIATDIHRSSASRHDYVDTASRTLAAESKPPQPSSTTSTSLAAAAPSPWSDDRADSKAAPISSDNVSHAPGAQAASRDSAETSSALQRTNSDPWGPADAWGRSSRPGSSAGPVSRSNDRWPSSSTPDGQQSGGDSHRLAGSSPWRSDNATSTATATAQGWGEQSSDNRSPSWGRQASGGNGADSTPSAWGSGTQGTGYSAGRSRGFQQRGGWGEASRKSQGNSNNHPSAGHGDWNSQSRDARPPQGPGPSAAGRRAGEGAAQAPAKPADEQRLDYLNATIATLRKTRTGKLQDEYLVAAKASRKVLRELGRLEDDLAALLTQRQLRLQHLRSFEDPFGLSNALGPDLPL